MLEDAKKITLDFQVYPNPANDFLKLKIQGLSPEKLMWRIFNISGKMLDNQNISAPETLIPITNYVGGIYLLSVFDQNNRQFRTFKIIKN